MLSEAKRSLGFVKVEWSTHNHRIHWGIMRPNNNYYENRPLDNTSNMMYLMVVAWRRTCTI